MNSHQRRIERRKKSPRFQWQNLKKLVGKVRHRTLVAEMPTPESVELARIKRGDHLFGTTNIGIPKLPKFKLHPHQEQTLREIQEFFEKNGRKIIVDVPGQPTCFQDARSRLLRGEPNPTPLIINFEAGSAELDRATMRILKSRKKREGDENITLDFNNLNLTDPEGESNGN